MLPRARISRALVSLCVLASALAPALAAQCELETQEFSPADGQSGDVFGYRLARAGDVAVVAASFDDDLGIDSGSAYVYRRDPVLGWVLAKKLLASDGAAGDIFAYSVAVDGLSVLVGAPRKTGAAVAQGAVYVFARDQGGPGNWGEVAILAPASAGPGALFGHALAVHGDRLLVGAPYTGLFVPGAAYLYRRDPLSASGWTLELEFSSADPATGFAFGHAVALDDDALAVSGAVRPEVPYSSSYVVHVRERDAGGAGNWGEVRSIASPTGQRDIFAYKLALSGGLLAAVAPGEYDFDTNRLGALYLFARGQGAPGQWGPLRRLSSSSAGTGVFLPEQVVLSGEWLVAGSPAVDNAGAAFVFGRNVGGSDVWGEIGRLQDLPLTMDSAFGQGLALEGDELLVGASGYDSPGPSGEVYAYDLARLARSSWRNDAAAVNPDSLTVSAPILGSILIASVDLRTTGHAFAALLAFANPAEIPFPGGQVLLGQQRLLTMIRPGPLASFALAIPADPALCALPITLQAAHVAVVQPFAFSNAQDLVLGVH